MKTFDRYKNMRSNVFIAQSVFSMHAHQLPCLSCQITILWLKSREAALLLHNLHSLPDHFQVVKRGFWGQLSQNTLVFRIPRNQNLHHLCVFIHQEFHCVSSTKTLDTFVLFNKKKATRSWHVTLIERYNKGLWKRFERSF